MTTAAPKLSLRVRRKLQRKYNDNTTTALFKALTARQERNPCFRWFPYQTSNDKPVMKRSPFLPSEDSSDDDDGGESGCFLSFLIAIIICLGIIHILIK